MLRRGADGVIHLDCLALPGHDPLNPALLLAALTAANRQAGEALFRWRLLPAEGPLPPVAGDPPTLALFGGEAAPEPAETRLLPALRTWRRHGRGLILLGIAPGRPGWRDLLPPQAAPRCGEPWRIDGTLAVARGGLPALELAEELIARAVTRRLSVRVAAALGHLPPAPQRSAADMDSLATFGVAHPVLSRALATMRGSLDTPVSVARLAREAGVTPRQLQRLFRQHLGERPQECYRRLRLEASRHQLIASGAEILDIALANGFRSASHFSKVYRQHFGHSPSAERRDRAAAAAARVDHVVKARPGW